MSTGHFRKGREYPPKRFTDAPIADIRSSKISRSKGSITKSRSERKRAFPNRANRRIFEGNVTCYHPAEVLPVRYKEMQLLNGGARGSAWRHSIRLSGGC